MRGQDQSVHLVTEFTAEMKSGGFSIIIGNPPYIRIQNMVAYSPEEVAFYQGAGVQIHDRSR